MSFFHSYRRLRSGNTYKNDGTSTRFSFDMVEGRINANLEPLHAQISALTEMMDRLIQGNSTREITTASTRVPRLQSESPFTEVTGTSRFLPLAPRSTAGYLPDSGQFSSHIATIFYFNVSLLLIFGKVENFWNLFVSVAYCQKFSKKNQKAPNFFC